MRVRVSSYPFAQGVVHGLVSGVFEGKTLGKTIRQCWVRYALPDGKDAIEERREGTRFTLAHDNVSQQLRDQGACVELLDQGLGKLHTNTPKRLNHKKRIEPISLQEMVLKMGGCVPLL